MKYLIAYLAGVGSVFLVVWIQNKIADYYERIALEILRHPNGKPKEKEK